MRVKRTVGRVELRWEERDGRWVGYAGRWQAFTAHRLTDAWWLMCHLPGMPSDAGDGGVRRYDSDREAKTAASVALGRWLAGLEEGSNGK
jgi:hypothetical protein